MLTREQQREILAIGLLALALILLLSLVPASVLGERGLEWFPSGNPMGALGTMVSGLMGRLLGTSSFLIPALVALGGVSTGGWLSSGRAPRLAALVTGLMVLVPVTFWVVTAEPERSGWIGYQLGDPLVGLVGVLGALLITAVLLIALSVATLGWNPLRALGGAALRSAAMGRGALSRWAGRLEAVLEERRAAAEERRARRREEAEARARAEAEAREAAALEAERAAAETPAEVEEEPVEAEAEPMAPAETVPEEPADEPAEAPPPRRPRDGEEHEEVPPMDLLTAPDAEDREGMERELDELGRILVEKLATFNVESELGGRTTGPMVTQFEVIPAPGVKVNRIANLDADLALAMRAQSVRIVAPIPGKGAVGVEVPNPKSEIVNLREILETPRFQSAKSELPLALGKDLHGRPYVAALEKMPHVLIAGATGSGKSVCINTIVTSLVYRHTPKTLRLLMIDPKMVELSVYSQLPHLRHNVVTDPRDAAGVLKWAVLEMERRYSLLKANHVRSIAEFNRKVADGEVLRRAEAKGAEGDEDRWIYDDGIMPYVVVVVDELADLMMTVQAEVEKPLTQLAQKARAIGIHLIVATQRPSVNVITGLIKANFPARIAFRVASKTDSRTILDQNGADALLGNGDMLFLPPGQSEPVRIQGAFLPTEDTERLMDWYRELLDRHEDVEEEPGDEDDILEQLRTRELEEAAAVVEEISGEWDELFQAAAEVCIQNGGGSTSLLQRRLSIGYGRAARIVDQLFDAGVLGPSDGAKGREVLVSMEELEAIIGAGPGAGAS